jgi:phosphoribosylaminoimidazole-succinocarboxamide synthase
MQYIPMSRRRRLYEETSKILFEGSEPGTLIQHFKDETTLINGEESCLEGKGVLSNRISEYLFKTLNEIGIPHHFMKRLNMREQLLREVDMLPLKVVVYNRVSPMLAKRLGLKEGSRLSRPLIELYYSHETLGDEIVSEEHLFVFGWATPSDLDEIMTLATRTNDCLSGLFLGIGVRLMEFKFQLGRSLEDETSRIIIASELSPETCQLQQTNVLDSESDLHLSHFDEPGKIYATVARRLGLLTENEATSRVIPLRNSEVSHLPTPSPMPIVYETS